jgi:hypothetical protein
VLFCGDRDGLSLTTSHVTVAATAIVHTMKTATPRRLRTVDIAT